MRFALALLLLIVPAAAEDVVVRTDRCVPRAAYQPVDGVEFQPGIDVNGHPVVPADLPYGGPVIGPEDIEVDIEVPNVRTVRDRFPRPRPRSYSTPIQTPSPNRPSVRDFDATVEVGTVTLGPDGTVYFDGVELGPQAVPAEGCE